ncbi:MAG: LolA-like putative outer membrane lipoprotein chaperone [Bacteroidetes bacterium]|jgi:outer membrane lipoprotein-sorting protein|nr:LolA-like putative outer membrane lipoprotein chaperone [Bacteroidota bacterium]
MRSPIAFILLLTSLAVSAQKENAAKAILDQIGSKVKDSKGMMVTIQMVSKNNKGKALGTKQISLKMKGDKYYLKQGVMEILCDGKTIYNFDGVNTISKSSVAESDQTLSPQKLLAGNYDKDFNYSLLSQTNSNATIELIPIDKRKSFQKVTLIIDKLKSALSNASILDKSNNSTEVKVVSINFNAILSDNLFLFNRAKYPKNVEIFD